MKRSTVYLENEVHTFSKHIILLLHILFISCHIGGTDGQIKNVLCVNDYDQEMVCYWEIMDLETNCTTKYQLFYERAVVPLPSNRCIPANVKVDGSVLMNKCSCTINAPVFHAKDQYTIEIKSDGMLLHEETISPSQNIKPKTPGNLTIDVNKNGDYMLRWDKRYHLSSYLQNPLHFEVYYYNKHDRSENYSFTSNKKETYFEINRRLLKSGSEYVAKIRSGLNEDSDSEYRGYWSDFSHEVQWRTDGTDGKDGTDNSFPASLFFICLLIIPLVVLCYCGIRIIKKKNWGVIPDPSKSSILFTMVGKSEISENLHSLGKNSSDEKPPRHLKINSRWLACIAPCLFDRKLAQNHVPKTVGNQTANGSPKIIEFQKQYERSLSENLNILIPENVVGDSVTVSGKPDNNEADEDVPQDEDKQVSTGSGVCNSSINKMFNDMLGISLSPLENGFIVGDEKSENSENGKGLQSKPFTHSLTDFSFFGETNQLGKPKGSGDSTLYSPKQSTESYESGYRSFESEVGHVEPEIYSEPMPIEEAQSLPSNQNRNCQIEVSKPPALGFDSPYNSFSSAVLQCENQAGESGDTHIAWPVTSLAASFANSPLVYNTDQAHDSDAELQFHNFEMGYDQQSVYPQNSIKNDFPLWEGEQGLLFLPNRDLLAEITPLNVSSISSKMVSATLPHPSGYQSFENAVKQEKTATVDEADLFTVDDALLDRPHVRRKEDIPSGMFGWEPDRQNLGKVVEMTSQQVSLCIP